MSFNIIDAQTYNQGKIRAIVEMIIECEKNDLSSIKRSVLYAFIEKGSHRGSVPFFVFIEIYKVNAINITSHIGKLNYSETSLPKYGLGSKNCSFKTAKQIIVFAALLLIFSRPWYAHYVR